MKFELIKEVKPNGSVMYYTKMDGSYVSDSVAFDEVKAKSLYDFFVTNQTNKSVELVLESVEIKEEEAK
jgi:hypothetical protein